MCGTEGKRQSRSAWISLRSSCRTPRLWTSSGDSVVVAYLPADGDRPAPSQLPPGTALPVPGRHAAQPGQQLIVPLSRLLADHWVTPQSEVERASLSALDAFIDPPGGLSGFRAVLEAELHPVGPTPTGADDERLERLVDAFNEARGGRTDRAIVDPYGSDRAHYETLTRFAWDLAWRCLHREARYPEAASVQRRWDEDRREYTRHLIGWHSPGGAALGRLPARRS